MQQTDAGCCIAKLEEIVPSHVPPFTEVQGEIRKTLIERARRESEKTLLQKLRSEADLHTYPAGERLLAN